MARNAETWFKIMRRCRISEAAATIHAPAWASEIKDNTFSRGDDDLKGFVPNVFYESSGLTKMKENLVYREARIIELGNASPPGSRWRKAVPIADQLAGHPDLLAEHLYGGRFGNDEPGDGAKFIGRTSIMLTFKDNYRWMSNLIGNDLVDMPHLAEGPYFGTEIAIHYWEGRVPDTMLGDQRAMRMKVQGGDWGSKEINDMARLVAVALDEFPV